MSPERKIVLTSLAAGILCASALVLANLPASAFANQWIEPASRSGAHPAAWLSVVVGTCVTLWTLRQRPAPGATGSASAG